MKIHWFLYGFLHGRAFRAQREEDKFLTKREANIGDKRLKNEARETTEISPTIAVWGAKMAPKSDPGGHWRSQEAARSTKPQQKRARERPKSDPRAPGNDFRRILRPKTHFLVWGRRREGSP